MVEITPGGAGGLAPTSMPSPAVEASSADVPSVSVAAPKAMPKIPGNPGPRAGADGESGEATPEPQADQESGLGAGGTSAALPTQNEQDASVGGGKTLAKGTAAAATLPAAGAAGQVVMLLMFLNWLKGMAMTLIALGMNLWNLALGLLLAVAKGAVGAIMGIGGAVSGAVGGAVSAVTAGIVSVAAGTAVAAVLIATAITAVVTGGNLAIRDASPVSCSVSAQAALDHVNGSGGQVDAQELANAKTVYSVLSAWGMPDENIAGVLGNWDAESGGIDPTAVEGDFNAPQQMTEQKQTEAQDTGNGIGLGQWTGGRNTKLRQYAAGQSKDWWDISVQLGFLISPSEGANADVVKDMIKTSYGTPSAAALHFHDAWERSADDDAQKQRRADDAVKWMGLFGGWTKNQALADSILAQAGTTVPAADSSRAAALRADCLSVGTAAIIAKPGGLTLDEATALINLYKQEGEQFLDSRYGAGGPGDCGFGKADNCVGFDTYFMNKYTSFQQFAPGNGIDQAASIAKMTGKTTSTVPSVYSIASGPGTGPEGHVMVILGIDGDQAIIGEAACGTDGAGTRAYTRPLSEITNTDWTFVDVSDLITDQPASS